MDMTKNEGIFDMSTIADLFRERVAFDLEQSWCTGKAQQDVHKVHPAHRKECFNDMAWWSAHSRGQEYECEKRKPIDGAVAKFLAASEQLDKCLAEFDGDECSCGEYFAAWQDQMAELRRALETK